METGALLLHGPAGNPSPRVSTWGLNVQAPDSVKGPAVRASLGWAEGGLYRLPFVVLIQKPAIIHSLDSQPVTCKLYFI